MDSAIDLHGDVAGEEPVVEGEEVDWACVRPAHSRITILGEASGSGVFWGDDPGAAYRALIEAATAVEV